MDDASPALELDLNLRPSWQKHPNFSIIFGSYSRVPIDDDWRPHPELWDICNGCILWLPPKDKIETKINPDSRLLGKDPRFFNHPTLVLDVAITSPRSAMVSFVKMTTFGNNSLQHAKPRNQWNWYLPVHPAETHPLNGTLLHLENESPSRGMTKNSYICLDEGSFSLDWTAFRCYSRQRADGYRQRLTSESFEQVMSAMHLESRPWVETNHLWENFRYKHIPASPVNVAALSPLTTQPETM